MRQALRPGALGKPRGSGWRGKWEGGSGWGSHVNPWLFHFNVRQNSLQIKKKYYIVFTDNITTNWFHTYVENVYTVVKTSIKNRFI